jgi:hypothetical protein
MKYSHSKGFIKLSVLAGLRLGLKNRQVGEKWVSDDCSYLCKGLYIKAENAIKNCLINSIPLSICGLFKYSHSKGFIKLSSW